MTMPQTGPNANAPTSTGISEKSNLRNGGINGSGTSRYISTNAIAVRMAVTVIRRIMALRRVLESAMPTGVETDM